MDHWALEIRVEQRMPLLIPTPMTEVEVRAMITPSSTNIPCQFSFTTWMEHFEQYPDRVLGDTLQGLVHYLIEHGNLVDRVKDAYMQAINDGTFR